MNAEREIETFERQFILPLETSLDDSGYAPGSSVDDEEVCDSDEYKKFKTSQESSDKVDVSEEKAGSDFDPSTISPDVEDHILLNYSSDLLDSEYDSGTFSRTSTPENWIKSVPQLPLLSPSMVLTVDKTVKRYQSDHT